MNVIIFGATGTIGRHLVKQALAQGHLVSAFTRDPAALKIEHPNLRYRVGDVLNTQDVMDAMPEHEAVLIALGNGRKGGVRQPGTQNIVQAMKASGVRRLVCMSSLGAGDSDSLLNFFWKHVMFGMLLKKALADHNAQEAVVMQSGNQIEWVIARPAAFTDGNATGNYRHGTNLPRDGLRLKISRADVASFLLKQLADDTYLRQTPALSY